MARTVDEDLDQLERDIRQLKIEYEQYFGGGKSRPPTEIEWRVEALIKRYADRGAQVNFGQRFRYSSLTQMYAKYREMFRKRLKQREEGTVQRHFGAAAREIEAERARQRAAAPASTNIALPFAVSWKDPDHEQTKVDQLYQAFKAAKGQAGEETGKVDLAAFRQFVRKKTEELKKQQGANEVEYVVHLEGKHVRLKARVKS